MMETIVGCFVSLFWSFAMLALILYLFALFFVQQVTTYLVDNDFSTDDPRYQATETYFPTVQTAILTLYQCTSGGNDWEQVYTAVERCGFAAAFAFIFFLGFFNFAVLNILAAVFLEKTLRNAEPDREAMMLEQRRNWVLESQALTELFQRMDSEGLGCINYHQFEENLKDSKVRLYFASLGLEVNDAKMFFKVLTSISGTSDIAIDDFIDHCTKMKGPASSIDLHGLAFQVKLMHRQIKQLVDFIVPRTLGSRIVRAEDSIVDYFRLDSRIMAKESMIMSKESTIKSGFT